MSNINKSAIYILLTCIFCICAKHFVNAQENVVAMQYEEDAKNFVNQGNKQKAIELFGKAAYSYWNKNQSIKAIENFQQLLGLFLSIENQKGSYSVYNSLGVLYSDIDNYPEALLNFKKGLELCRKLKIITEIPSCLINVAVSLQSMGKYNEALVYLDEALKLTTEVNDLKLMRKCYGLIAESYERNNNSDEAFQYYEKFSAIDKKIKAMEMEQVQTEANTKVNTANFEKQATQVVLDKTTNVLRKTADSLAVTERIAREQQMEIELRNTQLREKENQLQYERKIRLFWIIAMSVFVLLSLGLGFLFMQKIKDNQLLKKQKTEIEKQNFEIQNQRDKLDKQNKNITASINYAKTIQNAILPPNWILNENNETFVIYRPKDIVSGDFYFFTKVISPNQKELQVAAVVDCTGHGVPGAFMSMIGNRLLTEIVNEHKIINPAQILEQLNTMLRKALNQDKGENNDGMDVSLCVIDKNNLTTKVLFAGAKRPLYYFNCIENKIETVEADRYSIGGHSSEKELLTFSTKELILNNNDIIYMTTDGAIDQNRPNRDRFGTPRFVETLLKNALLPMSEQKLHFEAVFDNFVQNAEQRDDITVIGIKI